MGRPGGMTYEGYQAAMDKMWPTMEEPDGEGIDLHTDDHKRRFIATSKGVIFSQAPPLTEEDRLEADWLWDSIAMPGTSLGTVTPKKKTH